MTIDQNGNVGIGTTTPAAELEVESAGNTFARIYTSSSTSQAGITLHVDTDTTANDYWTIYQSNGTGHDLRFSTGAVGDSVTFDTAGRVGIGTTSPLHDLTIGGNSPALSFSSPSDTNRYRIDANITESADFGLSVGYWDGAAYQRTMTFDDGGNVGIGTTAPNSQLEVVSTSQRAFKLDRAEDVASGGVTCGIMQIGTDATNPGTDDYWILFRRGSDTTVGSVRGTGSASVNFSTTSDATLKTDRGIATASRVGTIIDGLQVHEFDWNEGDVTNQIGLFAQEAMPHLPDSIVADSDTDEEGNYIPASLDYSKIVPILIAEIQFLRGRLAALEAA